MWNKSKFCDNAKIKCKSTVVKGVSGLSIWCTSLTAKPITWFGESRFPRRYKQASMNCSRIEGKLVPTLKFCRIPSCLEPPGFCKFILPVVPSWIYILWCTVCEYLKAHHTTVTGLRRWKHKKKESNRRPRLLKNHKWCSMRLIGRFAQSGTSVMWFGANNKSFTFWTAAT